MKITPYLDPIETVSPTPPAYRYALEPDTNDEPSATELTETLIRSLLVRPGSDVTGLLCDQLCADPYLSDINALHRRAAGLLDREALLQIGMEFVRIQNVAIEQAAAEIGRAKTNPDVIALSQSIADRAGS